MVTMPDMLSVLHHTWDSYLGGIVCRVEAPQQRMFNCTLMSTDLRQPDAIWGASQAAQKCGSSQRARGEVQTFSQGPICKENLRGAFSSPLKAKALYSVPVVLKPFFHVKDPRIDEQYLGYLDETPVFSCQLGSSKMRRFVRNLLCHFSKITLGLNGKHKNSRGDCMVVSIVVLCTQTNTKP